MCNCSRKLAIWGLLLLLLAPQLSQSLRAAPPTFEELVAHITKLTSDFVAVSEGEMHGAVRTISFNTMRVAPYVPQKEDPLVLWEKVEQFSKILSADFDQFSRKRLTEVMAGVSELNVLLASGGLERAKEAGNIPTAYWRAMENLQYLSEALTANLAFAPTEIEDGARGLKAHVKDPEAFQAIEDAASSFKTNVSVLTMSIVPSLEQSLLMLRAMCVGEPVKEELPNWGELGVPGTGCANCGGDGCAQCMLSPEESESLHSHDEGTGCANCGGAGCANCMMSPEERQELHEGEGTGCANCGGAGCANCMLSPEERQELLDRD